MASPLAAVAPDDAVEGLKKAAVDCVHRRRQEGGPEPLRIQSHRKKLLRIKCDMNACTAHKVKDASLFSVL
jgi:hypothetical protein